jgi:hypothetical protein
VNAKAKIIKVGAFDAEGSPTGWSFDCGGSGSGIDISTNPPGIAGWTFEELREISAEQIQRCKEGEAIV